METSSIPMMIALQQYAGRNKIGINSFSIRKERKSYGLFQFIDGMPTESPVIVLDDTINSGKSLSRCFEVCKYELGLTPAPVAYSIIKFNDKMDAVRWNENRIEVVSLFSVNDFSMEYDPSKYWLPSDCDKSYNKRPEYN
jgi:orotate phosphoribosyltransferase